MAACEAVSAGGRRDGAGGTTGSRCGEASAAGRARGASAPSSVKRARRPAPDPRGWETTRPGTHARLGDHARPGAHAPPGAHAAGSPRSREPTWLGTHAAGSPRARSAEPSGVSAGRRPGAPSRSRRCPLACRLRPSAAPAPGPGQPPPDGLPAGALRFGRTRRLNHPGREGGVWCQPRPPRDDVRSSELDHVG